MDLFEHPGNLGPTRGTLLTVHHADWPAYPEGNDFRTPLLQLTAFPAHTNFIVADDIDRSLLLVADVQCGAPDKPFDPRNFHIAVWYEDLIEMHNQGLVAGVECVTERDWHLHKWSQLRSRVPPGTEIGYEDPSPGNFIRLQEPSLDEYEDDDCSTEQIVSKNGRITVTEKGRQFLLRELQNEHLDLSAAVSAKVAQLFDLGFFDTCIREACVQLEHEIKTQIHSQQYGEKLTESFVNRLRTDQLVLESDIRTFRQELRALFKLIRNDYMHNLFDADMVTAYTVLFRIGRIRAMLGKGPTA